jgi:phage-related protein
MAPGPGTDTDNEMKILSADFGDGYSQETADGLNHVRKTVTLEWPSCTEAQATTIENTLTGYGGTQPFKYTLRGDSLRHWTCKKVGRKRGSLNTVSATFREFFGAED